MKTAKVIGALFIAVGLLLAILGAIKYAAALMEKEDRTYSTATIVKIEQQETGDPEFPYKHTTYVELDVNGERITAPLNTYNSSFKTGKKVEVYYFKNDVQLVYEKGSENYFVLFAVSGAAFAVLGALLTRLKERNISHRSDGVPHKKPE